MTRRYVSGTLISGPHRGGHLFGRYLQSKNKGNGLKKEGVTYSDARFGPLRGGVSYLDTGTLQDTGHLLGGGFYMRIVMGQDVIFIPLIYTKIIIYTLSYTKI